MYITADRKMVEYSELIDKTLTLAGGALGVKLFDYYLTKKREKKEDKIKETFLNSLKDISLMNHFMCDVIDNTDADRFLILMGHDSGNIPNPKHPYFAKAMWHKLKNNNDNESLVRKYDSVRVDFEYINMIIDLVTKGSVFLDVDRMPDCFLKRVYVDEGVKYSELYFLAQEKSNKIYYCSIATTKEGSRLEKLNDRMKIELAINHLRQIFEKI